MGAVGQLAAVVVVGFPVNVAAAVGAGAPSPASEAIPSDVTLGGQSAGASETGSNVISPKSEGLFERAIFQSSPTSTFPPLSLALTRGTVFAQAAGCPGDGAGAASCLLGITEYFSGPPMQPLTADQYEAAVTPTYSGNAGPGGSPLAYAAGTADKVLAEYPVSNYPTPQLADDAAFTDPGACRALHVDNLWSKHVPVYAYEFDYQNALYYFPPMSGFVPLAAHMIDIQFLFPLWHGGQLGVSHPLTRTRQGSRTSSWRRGRTLPSREARTEPETHPGRSSPRATARCCPRTSRAPRR